MEWLRSQYEDSPRRFLVVIVSAALSLSLLFVGGVPAAYADVCGTQPDWWTLDYINYLSCEAQNGGAATAVQAVASPVFNNIDSDINGMSGSITSALSPLQSLSGNITGAISNVTNLFVPQASDGPALAADIQNLSQQNSALAYASTLGAEISAMQSSIDAMGATPSGTLTDGTNTTLPGDPVTFTDAYGNTQTVGLGPVGTGVEWFLYGLDRLGFHPQQFRQFFDAWWAVVVVVAILRDLGVHFGAVPASIGEHRSFWSSRKGGEDD